MRDSIITPGWGSVNLSQFTNHTPKFGYSRERWIFNNCGVLFNPYPLVGTAIIFTVAIRTYASNLEGGAC